MIEPWKHGSSPPPFWKVFDDIWMLSVTSRDGSVTSRGPSVTSRDTHIDLLTYPHESLLALLITFFFAFSLYLPTSSRPHGSPLTTHSLTITPPPTLSPHSRSLRRHNRRHAIDVIVRPECTIGDATPLARLSTFPTDFPAGRQAYRVGPRSA